MNNITHIIWDFNGTVLDDAHQAVAAVNDMLISRGLATTDIERYRDTITMPLTEYYKTVGIYCDDIALLSQEFRAASDSHPELARIFDGVHEVVQFARLQGIKNVLMSSLYHEHLIAETEKYGVTELFDMVLGLPDRMLRSKYRNAKSYFEKEGIDAKCALFIGDLASDADMAHRLGSECILISQGHMSKARCQEKSEVVYEDVKQVIEYIKRA